MEQSNLKVNKNVTTTGGAKMNKLKSKEISEGVTRSMDRWIGCWVGR